MGLAKVKHILAAAILSSIAFVVYADDAPVYEVDNYPPAFDNQQVDPPTGAPAVETNKAVETHNNTVSQQETYTPPPRPLTMEQRIQRMEQQIKNLQQSASTTRMDDMQKEVQGLRGQVEEMAHQLQLAQNQLKAMYADLDKRLMTLQSTKPASVEKETSSPSIPLTKSTIKKTPTVGAVVQQQTTAAPNIAEEQQIYQTAYDLIKAKKYNDAVTTLQKMLKKYPSGQTAANAHYWLGELYSLLNKGDQSADEFSTVVKKYPESPKVPDAHLKLGLIYVGQFKWAEAKTVFKDVTMQYPGTASARLAKEQLKQIKKAGH